MGSISRERLTLNEKTLWTGGPAVTDDPSYYWDCNRQSAHILPEIWQAFLDGDDELATRLTNIHFRAKEDKVVDGEKIDRFGFMTTLGELHIETGLREGSRPLDFDIASDRKKHGGILKNMIKERYRPDVKSGPGETVDDYERSLSLDSALVRVAFRQDGISYKREYFISHPDEVLAIRFTADRKKALNLKLGYLSNPLASGTAVSEGGDGIFYSGVLKNNGEKFALRIKAEVKDGKLESKDGVLTIAGATQAEFLVAAATDYKMNFDPDFTDCNTYFKGEDPSEVTVARIAAASKLGWKRLLERHLDDYQSLFKRVDLQIDGDNAGSALPTPFRMDRYRKGLEDPGLEALYFQYGRYLLIASCREGNLPMNLQGIWCNELAGPWNTDYHNNVNIQEDFWPANQTNLDECVTPLVDYIRTMQKPGEKVAQAYYNARGWTVGISSNIYGFASPGVNESMISNLSPANGPWLATHLWDRYTFTMDKDYLADVYDLLAGSADYCCDFLWKHPDGYYTAAPTTSPEHGPIGKGVTFVHAVVREVLIDAMRAAQVLGRDEERVKEWNNVLENLPPYRIGRYGQLMEWSKDIDDPDDDHRHVNHLFGLHPGSTISLRETPDLAAACKVVLEHRGDLGRGWSIGYDTETRERLCDVYMDKFKEIFGEYPKSVGSWFIDAETLAYFYEKYGIEASCNCRDQIGTDGYTLWGGYWNGAYYPSRQNAFTWKRFGEGFQYQMKRVAELDREGKLKVEPLLQTASDFKARYPSVTPPSSIVVTEDARDNGCKTYWFNCRNYRANLFWNGNTLKFRDIHVFDEGLRSEYLDHPDTLSVFRFETLPLVDGVVWSTEANMAGLYLVAPGFKCGALTFRTIAGGNGQQIEWPSADGRGGFVMTFTEDAVSIRSKGKVDGWHFEMSVNPGTELSFTSIAGSFAEAEYLGRKYGMKLSAGSFEDLREEGFGKVFRIVPDGGRVTFGVELKGKAEIKPAADFRVEAVYTRYKFNYYPANASQGCLFP